MTNGRFDHVADGPFMGAMREVWWWLRARPRLLWGGIAGLVALIALAGSYYQVEPDEVGMVTRFGRFVRIHRARARTASSRSASSACRRSRSSGS